MRAAPSVRWYGHPTEGQGMSAAGTAAQRTTITRTAPSGSAVRLLIPQALGDYQWYGNTRFLGPRVQRQFFLAPAGEHRVIPRKILAGGREVRQTFRGHDVVLFEAADRSDAALVWAGPHSEATTWFGGPAPDASMLRYMIGTVEFRDSANGAALKPTSPYVRSTETSLIGMNGTSRMIVRSAAEALPLLPDWAGLKLPGGELWRAPRGLIPADAGRVAGSPHQWRYLLASPTAVLDVVLLGPESGRSPTALTDNELVETLSALSVSWSG
jgi:hypothetical protein